MASVRNRNMLKAPHPTPPMYRPLQDESIKEEFERDMQRFRDARKRAEELVRDWGWSEEDEDFEFQIEQEAKRQWEEDYEREMERILLYEDIQNESYPPNKTVL